MPPPTSSWPAPARTPSASSRPSGSPRSTSHCPVGNGEQRLNAAAAVAAGGGLLVDDAAVTRAWVTSVVSELVMDADRLAAMAAASASVGERDGDELLADLVVSAAARGR